MEIHIYTIKILGTQTLSKNSNSKANLCQQKTLNPVIQRA